MICRVCQRRTAASHTEICSKCRLEFAEIDHRASIEPVDDECGYAPDRASRVNRLESDPSIAEMFDYYHIADE